MSKFRCNSCGGTYADTDGAPHVCPPEIIEYAEFAADGQVLKPEKRTPRQNIRDERRDTSIIYVDGNPMRRVPNPEERGQFLLAPAIDGIVSEGAGRTEVV